MSTHSRLKPLDLIAELKTLQYDFRYNECTGDIEINGAKMTDTDEAIIRTQLRTKGLHVGPLMLSDSIIFAAYQNSYHSIRDYLKSIKPDGQPHIAQLASFVTDTDNVFGIWLRKWLIGSMAKMFEAERQPMLVMDGPQGIGKSEFVRRLCPLPEFFIEGPVSPDDKDDKLRLASNWIWEVAELGATIRRADRESLKFFISQRSVTVRPAYGRRDVKRPAMASLFGTVNNECGFLNDPTGSTRFLVCHIEKIDWSYSSKVDIQQVWGEAYTAYLNGESWKLNEAELAAAQAINERYEIDDAVEGLLKKHFIVDPRRVDWWVSTTTILETLYGKQGHTRANALGLGSCCVRLGLMRARKRKRGQQVWGFRGLKLH